MDAIGEGAHSRTIRGLRGHRLRGSRISDVELGAIVRSARRASGDPRVRTRCVLVRLSRVLGRPRTIRAHADHVVPRESKAPAGPSALRGTTHQSANSAGVMCDHPRASWSESAAKVLRERSYSRDDPGAQRPGIERRSRTNASTVATGDHAYLRGEDRLRVTTDDHALRRTIHACAWEGRLATPGDHARTRRTITPWAPLPRGESAGTSSFDPTRSCSDHPRSMAQRQRRCEPGHPRGERGRSATTFMTSEASVHLHGTVVTSAFLGSSAHSAGLSPRARPPRASLWTTGVTRAIRMGAARSKLAGGPSEVRGVAGTG